jgi:hypothetical protein
LVEKEMKETAKPYVITIVIPVEDTAYLYIGARSKEEAAEAAKEMLASNSSQYPNAAITDVSEYKPPDDKAPATVSLN